VKVYRKNVENSRESKSSLEKGSGQNKEVHRQKTK